MFRIVSVLVALLASCDCSRLWEFNELFVNRSSESTQQVLQKWRENNRLNGILNEQILVHMGEMVQRIREGNAEVGQMLGNATGVDEDCLEYLTERFELVLESQKVDIQMCANGSYGHLNADSMNRFRPRAVRLLRDNSQALHQVVKSLGESGSSDIEVALEQKLREFETLLDEQLELLKKDLDDQGDIFLETIEDLDECRKWVYYFQDYDLGYIKSNIDQNCQ